MKRILLLCVAIFAFGFWADAQSYNQSLGIRGGFSNGIAYKKFINSGTALEFVVDPFVNGVELTGIYEKQKSAAFGAPMLDWYYGAGAYVGFYNGPRYGRKFDDPGTSSSAGMGALALVGLELILTEIPISITGDIGLAVNFAPYGGAGVHAGLGLRYYW